MRSADFVLQRDSTPVSIRVRGNGPGVLLIPGGLQTAADFDRLGASLATMFTTIVMERRGRGASRDLRATGSLDEEATDVLRIAKAMDARNIFGLSSGALIALRAAQLQPNALRSIALYEPPLASPGYETAFDWTDDVGQLLDANQMTAALTRMLMVVGDHWIIRHTPRFILRSAASVALRWGRGADGERLSALLPTFRQDACIVQDARTLLASSAAMTSSALLMNGDRAAAPLRAALDALNHELPRATRLTLHGVGHLAATNGGKPGRVASHLSRFFLQD
ncbi:alpha/beta fold hydrolase [Brachybacterium tyrofermentans]|uniref:alpha/beta fold hydrolase n=1 Tax=Brachybacterium tyrofermentans TaxID=47848 RepID=UPI003FD59CA8